MRISQVLSCRAGLVTWDPKLAQLGVSVGAQWHYNAFLCPHVTNCYIFYYDRFVYLIVQDCILFTSYNDEFLKRCRDVTRFRIFLFPQRSKFNLSARKSEVISTMNLEMSSRSVFCIYDVLLIQPTDYRIYDIWKSSRQVTNYKAACLWSPRVVYLGVSLSASAHKLIMSAIDHCNCVKIFPLQTTML